MIFFFLLFLYFLGVIFELSGGSRIQLVKGLSFDKFYFCYVAILMTLFASFRYKTGNDWSTYLMFFDNALTGTDYGLEKGYIIMNKFFKSHFDNFYLMQLICISLSSFFIYKNFYKHSEYLFITLGMYFFFYYLFLDFAAFRQHIATGIVCAGIFFIEKRKFLFWVGIVLFAMQFHISAIVAFPLYFTNRMIISKRTAFIILIVCFIVKFWGYQAVQLSVEFLGHMSFMPERLRSMAQAYLHNKYNVQIPFSLGMIVNYVFFTFMIFQYDENKNNAKHVFLLNFLIGLFFRALGTNFSVLDRFAGYYLVCGNGLLAYNLFVTKVNFYTPLTSLNFLRTFLMLGYMFIYAYQFYMHWNYGTLFNPPLKEFFAPYRSFIFYN